MGFSQHLTIIQRKSYCTKKVLHIILCCHFFAKIRERGIAHGYWDLDMCATVFLAPISHPILKAVKGLNVFNADGMGDGAKY
jgi:hypothetical protein